MSNVSQQAAKRQQPGNNQGFATPSGGHAAVTVAKGVLDMPDPWLLQLLAQLEPWLELPSIFMTCRFMRDFVLAQRLWPVRMRLSLPLAPAQAEAAHSKLQRACTLSSKVYLELQRSNVDPYMAVPGQQHARYPVIPIDLVPQGLTSGQARSSIVDVSLTSLHLDGLVPSCFLTCPNLRTLTVTSCLIARTPTVLECGQVESLLVDMCLVCDEGIDENIGTPAWWQGQLRALPGLTSLTIEGLPNSFLDCCLAASPGLTQLNFSRREAYLDCSVAPRTVRTSMVDLAGRFPRLAQLCVPLNVDDQGMEALLRLRQLTHLQCHNFQLLRSHSDRPCRWAHVGMLGLCVESLDRMSLDSVQSMRIWADCVTPSADLQVTTRVAAAMARCKIEQPQTTVLTVDGTGASADCLAEPCLSWRATSPPG